MRKLGTDVLDSAKSVSLKSYELFTRFMNQYDEKLPRSHAQRAKVSWEKLVERLQLA